ncbi:MAG: glycosyltransferase [Acidobacteria bacterium]|nr:glycosyltransferase [Acidobacteriota bacterium]
MRVALIIPALNEEDSIARTIRSLPAGVFTQVIVADNGSADRTTERAEAAGATVVREPRRGYGAACLAALAALPDSIEAVVFMDADGSDDPADLPLLLAPLERDEADLVLGSRELGEAEPGALTPQQRAGNRLASFLLRWLWGYRFTDLGPYRAIRRTSLESLAMRDTNYGWTIEMQIKAVRRGVRIREVGVRCRRRRAGRSKVSGSLWGGLAAGAKILWTVARQSWASS